MTTITIDKTIDAHAYGAGELRRGLAHYALGRATAAVCSVVTIIALVRLMPISEYAIYTAASAGAVLAATLSILGLDRVAMRFIPIGKMAGRPSDLYRFIVKLVGVRLLTIACIMLLIAAFQEPIGVWLQFDGRAVLLPLLVYTAALALSDSLSSVLQSLMYQEWLRRAITAQWAVRLAFVIAVAWHGMDLLAWHALWAWALSEVMFVLIMLVATRLSIATTVARAGAEAWQLDRGEVVRTAAANSVGSIAALTWQPYTLRVMGAIVLPTGELAAYGFFLSLIDRLRAYLPAQFLQGIAEPVLSSAIARRRDPAAISDLFAALLNVTAWIMVPLTLIVALCGGTLVSVLTGGKFAEHALVLSILLLQLLLAAPVTLLWSALNVTGRSAAIAKSMVLSTLVTYPLLIFAGLQFGALGMAVVGVINIVVSRVLMVKALHETKLIIRFGDECIVRTSWQSAGVLVPIAAVSALFPGPWQVLLVCALSGVLYVLLGLRFPPLSRGQLATLMRILPWTARMFDPNVVRAATAGREPSAAQS